MKAFITTMFLFSFVILFAQKDKIKYTGTAFYLESIDKSTKKVIARIPRGKNVKLIYDTFFKNWTIDYTTSDGHILHQMLNYLTDVDGEYQIMLDGEGHKWYVGNNIKINGLLLCVGFEEVKPGYVMGYSFEGIKPIK